MKKDKKQKITLSDKAYYEYYNQNNFYSLFLNSLVHSKSYFGILFSLLISIFPLWFIDISHIDKPREFIFVVSNGLVTYSITIIGFLIVSFTILIILNSSLAIFRYFAIEDEKYKNPLIRVLLSVFIVPIGVFVILLILCLIINFSIPVFSVNSFEYSTKRIIFKFFIGIISFLFIYSITEFLAFFHNIYKFIVISSYDASSNFELEVIKEKGVMEKFKLKIESDKEIIIKNIEEELEKIKKDHVAAPETKNV